MRLQVLRLSIVLISVAGCSSQFHGPAVETLSEKTETTWGLLEPGMVTEMIETKSRLRDADGREWMESKWTRGETITENELELRVPIAAQQQQQSESPQ